MDGTPKTRLPPARDCYAAREVPGISRAGRIDPPAAIAILQIGLGVATLVLVVTLPIAVAHQAGAIVLFCTAVWCAQSAAR